MAEDKVTQVNLKNYKTQIVVRKKKTTNYYLQSLWSTPPNNLEDKESFPAQMAFSYNINIRNC